MSCTFFKNIFDKKYKIALRFWKVLHNVYNSLSTIYLLFTVQPQSLAVFSLKHFPINNRQISLGINNAHTVT